MVSSSLRFALVFAFIAIRLWGKDTETEILSKLKPVPPCPAVVSAAKTNQTPLVRIDSPAQTDTLTPGDSVTALVTLFQKQARQTQWLVHLQSVTAQPGEQSSNPAQPMVLYSSLGYKLEFKSSPAVATVRTLGPFIESASKRPPIPHEKNARFVLDKGFLGLGLVHAAASSYRIKQPKPPKDKKTNGALWCQGTPCSQAQIEEGKKWAAFYQITPEEERAFVGSAPSLLSYFTVIQQTPGLSEILAKILDLPSAWSLIRSGGIKSVNIALQPAPLGPVDPTTWGLPAGTPAYYFPLALYLNDHRALNLTLIVTAPRPPLLLCGGIVGLLAERPGDKDTYLTLRIVNAGHSSPEDPKPPQQLSSVDQNSEPTSAKPPWNRIVVVGASASAGFTATEPLGGPTTPQYDLSRYLEAALLTPHEPSRNLANSLFFMQPEVMGRFQINTALRARPTLVVGGDFLFWFCYGEGTTDEERLQRFENGLKLLELVKCPLVVGDLPDASAAVNGMLRQDQIPSARALAAANRRLKEWSTARQNVTVAPLAEFMRSAMANQALTVHGFALPQGKTRALLQDDKLHPSLQGCAILALTILDTFQAGHPALSAREICWDPEKILSQASHSATGQVQ